MSQAMYMSYTVEYPCGSGAGFECLAGIRHLIKEFLAYARCHDASEACLAIGEIVSNSIEHAAPGEASLHLVINPDEDAMIVCVENPVLPGTTKDNFFMGFPENDLSERHRGLAIARALVDNLSVDIGADMYVQVEMIRNL